MAKLQNSNQLAHYVDSIAQGGSPQIIKIADLIKKYNLPSDVNRLDIRMQVSAAPTDGSVNISVVHKGFALTDLESLVDVDLKAIKTKVISVIGVEAIVLTESLLDVGKTWGYGIYGDFS